MTADSKKPIHVWNTWISFGDTDPARRIYFVRIFEFAHRCLEDYAIKKGIYSKWFEKVEWGTPVRHSEAEYLKPLRPGDEVQIKMFAEKLGKTSFTWRFEVFKADELMAVVKTTHVTVHIEKGITGPVPDSVRELF